MSCWTVSTRTTRACSSRPSARVRSTRTTTTSARERSTSIRRRWSTPSRRTTSRSRSRNWRPARSTTATGRNGRSTSVARILLGVTGGISAYKAVEVVRLATKAGHSVRVVQTPASLQFVGKATFEGITGAPVLIDEFEPDPARGAFPGDPAPDHAAISHLELVRRADVYAIVPASANTIAKLAHGMADNLLTSAALASTAPLVVAPAMNEKMWRHPATRANVDTLRERGATIVPPNNGPLASKGEYGEGPLGRPAGAGARVRGDRGDGGGVRAALARGRARARRRRRDARADRLGSLRRQ